MNISLFIAKRYLKAKHGVYFISFISWISVLGVMLGVAALLITLSVMNGFHLDLRNKILGVNPHIIVMDKSNVGIKDIKNIKDKIDNTKNVLNSSPFVYGQGILKNKKASIGAVIKGVLPEEEELTRLGSFIRRGSFNLGSDSIVLGKELARRLNVTIDSEVIFISPEFKLSSFGQMPRWKKLKVVGIFESGMYEYDSNLAYINLKTSQDVFKMDEAITGFGVRIKRFDRAENVSKTLEKDLGSEFFARSWFKTNYSLFTALRLEKIVMFIILILIVIVASFGITSSLMMMTMEKVRDIGILKAIGYSEKIIGRIFIYQGLFIGIIGTILGILLGLVIALLLDNYEFIKLPQDVYYLSTLPVNIRISDVLIVSIASIIISLVSTMYPAKVAAHMEPCKALRHE